jgi:hypothetical protein
MCLACTFDLMSPSVHSWRQESIDVVLPKSRKHWGQLSRLVLMPAERPRVPQTMKMLNQPANLSLHPHFGIVVQPNCGIVVVTIQDSISSRFLPGSS